MLTCITCTKHSSGGAARIDGSAATETKITSLRRWGEDEDCDYGGTSGTPSTRHTIKALTSQIKGMALKASGGYNSSKGCAGLNHGHSDKGNFLDSESASDSARFHGFYQWNGNTSSTPRLWGKKMEARLKVFSGGETTPASVSGRTELAVFVEEDEPREWVAQVERGVITTFLSLPRGGNELRWIPFCQELFNKWKAQRWWTENHDEVMELYNVQHSNRQGAPVPTTPTTEDEGSRVESMKASPVTLPLDKERLPRNIQRPATATGYSSSDSVENHRIMQSRPYPNSTGLATTPKPSSISGANTETLSVDGSVSSGEEEAEDSEELSMSNASDVDSEWVEQDEPGVHITIWALPNVERSSEKCRREYGGSRTGRGYSFNTCDRHCSGNLGQKKMTTLVSTLA